MIYRIYSSCYVCFLKVTSSSCHNTTFLHKVSVSENLSFQPNVSNLGECSIHQGAAAMVVVEDLKGVVVKLMWLAEVGCWLWVSMEVLLVDWSNQSLGAQDMRVGPVQVIPDPSACLNHVFPLVSNLDQVVLQGFILYPSQCPHYFFFVLFSIFLFSAI